ncbi:hypothetical protein L916_21414 [Phytophthora nicotianae]|uniref:Uncharacterized protein n=1 Tax=Phytophthora nicotianae TaxID=4792 RepID=W2HTV3_PHYNI|nr:hypothetical protein L916_21414 [Phytophthora nicotianae]
MQCIQHHIPRKDIKALIDTVESAFQQLKPHTVNDIFFTGKPNSGRKSVFLSV